MPAYALIIGINDYTAFAASQGAAPGSSDLRGAVNDARSHAVLARLLGYPAANIRVLTAPGLTAADVAATFEGRAPTDVSLDGATFGEATRAAIEEGLAWLAKGLAKKGSRGILAWSGHGDVRDEEGVLCPSDTVSGLATAFSYGELLERLGGVGTYNLTVLLDACHVAGRGRGTLSGGTLTDDEPRLGDHAAVYAACEPTGVAYEHHFDGRWHGAFSWALNRVLERWERADGRGYNYVRISNLELVERAWALLDALSFDQQPCYEGDPDRLGEAAFQFPAIRDDSFDPAALDDREIDPSQGTAFQGSPVSGLSQLRIFSDASLSTLVGWVVAVGGEEVTTGSVTWEPNRSYWHFAPSFLSSAGSYHGFPQADFWVQVSTAEMILPGSNAVVMSFDNGPFTGIEQHNPNDNHYYQLKKPLQNNQEADEGWVRVDHDNGELTGLTWWQQARQVNGQWQVSPWLGALPSGVSVMRYHWRGQHNPGNMEHASKVHDDVV